MRVLVAGLDAALVIADEIDLLTAIRIDEAAQRARVWLGSHDIADDASCD